MTQADVAAIIKKVHFYYPKAFEGQNSDDVVEAWHNILKPYDTEEISMLLDKYVTKSRFAPTLAEIIPQKKTTSSTKFSNFKQREDGAWDEKKYMAMVKLEVEKIEREQRRLGLNDEQYVQYLITEHSKRIEEQYLDGVRKEIIDKGG